MMNITNEEKIALRVLSLFLLAGVLVMHFNNVRPEAKITVLRNAVKEELSLKEVEERLKESRKIDINSAQPEELTNIPGIGDITAKRIVAYRDRTGSFMSETDLLNVEGIGPKTLEKIREYIRVE